MTNEITLVDAFIALSTDLARWSGESAPPTMTVEMRDRLVDFAERHICGTDDTFPPLQRNVARLKAILVAGSLATLDRATDINPFKQPELKCVYNRQLRHRKVQERFPGTARLH